MKKIKPSDLEGFVENLTTPYTDYSEGIAKWLKENAAFTGRSQPNYDCIFSSGEEFYCHFVKYSHDVYYTNEEFKEWIGMNKHTTTKKKLASLLNNEGQQVLDYLEGKVVNKMPKLVAGRHYVRFSDGRFGQVMDGYFNMVEICREWGAKIYGWQVMEERTISSIVEVFQPYINSGLHIYVEAFNSGDVTIWKKEDERNLRIQQELEFAKAKAGRLATHISILEQKLK